MTVVLALAVVVGCSTAEPAAVSAAMQADTKAAVDVAMKVMRIEHRPLVEWIRPCRDGQWCTERDVSWPEGVISIVAAPSIADSGLARGMWEWKVLSESNGDITADQKREQGNALVQAVSNYYRSAGL